MGGVITFKYSGNFNKTENLLKKAPKVDYRRILRSYGEAGVRALREATPVDSGLTASSWDYNILIRKDYMVLTWTNSNIPNGVPVAILIQYGHATRSGGYVQGRDYINPALRQIFDQLAEDAWKEIQRL